jgi:hypothetical protein
LSWKIKPKLLLLLGSGFAISCIGHMAILTSALIFAGANPFDVAPTEAITVDIVSPDEIETNSAKPAPTPAESAQPAPSFEPAAAPAQPQPEPQSAPQAPPPPSPPATRQASAATQAAPSSSSFTPWLQPPPEAPPPAEPHEPNPADMFGMPLALPGGMVGYEYSRVEGVATEKPDITDDAIAAFRKHLKTCSIRPARVAAEARFTLRIDLNPDGTLVKSPENPHAVGLIQGVTVGAGDLFNAAMAALRKCQPYKMMPPDRYEEWKTLDLTFTRENFGGG